MMVCNAMMRTSYTKSKEQKNNIQEEKGSAVVHSCILALPARVPWADEIILTARSKKAVPQSGNVVCERGVLASPEHIAECTHELLHGGSHQRVIHSEVERLHEERDREREREGGREGEREREVEDDGWEKGRENGGW